MNFLGWIYTIGCVVIGIASYMQESLVGIAIAIVLLLLLHG